LVALGAFSSDDVEWLYAYERFHRPILGIPCSHGPGDSNHGTIRCPLRNQVKIHASQVEDERRFARQSCSHLGGHPDFPAHTLLGSLLWNRLIIHRPCGDLSRDRRFSTLHMIRKVLQ